MSGGPARPEDWFPLDEAEHERQVGGLLGLLGDAPRRVVDLGAGDGRVARPLADAGHDVLCLDRDPDAVRRCEAAGLRARGADFLSPDADLSHPAGPPEAVLCLGHTLLTVHDPDDALSLFRRLRATVAPGAPLLVDNSPEELWSEISDGYWQAGLAETGDAQLVWARGDNVIAIRPRGEMDPDRETPDERDRRLRIWSLGELTLLGAATGWGRPEPLPEHALLRFEPA